MDISTTETNVLDEERWRAWEAKGKLRDAALARKLRIVIGATFGAIVLLAVAYSSLFR